MLAFLRCVLAFVVGSIVGGVFNMGLVQLNTWLFLPPGLARNDTAALIAALQSAPPQAFLLPLAAHAGHALLGAWVAARLAARARMVLGLLMGAFVMVGGILALRMIPHPAWFPFVDLALYLPAGWLGARLASPGKPAPARPEAVAA